MEFCTSSKGAIVYTPITQKQVRLSSALEKVLAQIDFYDKKEQAADIPDSIDPNMARFIQSKDSISVWVRMMSSPRASVLRVRVHRFNRLASLKVWLLTFQLENAYLDAQELLHIYETILNTSDEYLAFQPHTSVI